MLVRNRISTSNTDEPLSYAPAKVISTMAPPTNSEGDPWNRETKDKFEGYVSPLSIACCYLRCRAMLTFRVSTARTEANSSIHARRRPHGAFGVCIATGATGRCVRTTFSEQHLGLMLRGQPYADDGLLQGVQGLQEGLGRTAAFLFLDPSLT